MNTAKTAPFACRLRKSGFQSNIYFDMKILASNASDCNCSTDISPLTVTEWASRINPICSKQWLDDRRAKYSIALWQWNEGASQKATKAQLIANMQYCNTIVFYSALYSGALFKDPGAETWQVNRQKLMELVNGSIASKLQMTTSHLRMRLHGKKYFGDGCNSTAAYRTVRDHLKDLNIFDFDPVLPGSTFQPPTLRNIDLIGALILHEVCEREFYTRETWDAETQEYRLSNINDLPNHRCAIVRMIFNEVFRGVSEYNRSDSEYTGTEDLEDFSVEPQIDPRYKIYEPKLFFDPYFWKKTFIRHLKLSGKYDKSAYTKQREKPH